MVLHLMIRRKPGLTALLSRQQHRRDLRLHEMAMGSRGYVQHVPGAVEVVPKELAPKPRL